MVNVDSQAPYCLPPAARCLWCSKAYDPARGLRVIARHNVGVSFRHGPPQDAPGQWVEAETNVWLVHWGTDELWTCERLDAAMDFWRDGRRPWLCQQCVGPWCPRCGAPLQRPCGTDHLHDDGRITHVPGHPGGNICPLCR